MKTKQEEHLSQPSRTLTSVTYTTVEHITEGFAKHSEFRNIKALNHYINL